MRLDKYLKVSRLIKRRTLAKEVSEASRITINNRIAKPSSNVNINDIIQIRFGNKEVTIKVTAILESTKKSDAAEMYDLIKEERIFDKNDD